MSSTRIKGRQHQEQDDEYDSGSEEENPRWGGFAFMMDDSSSSSDDDDRDKDVEHDATELENASLPQLEDVVAAIDRTTYRQISA